MDEALAKGPNPLYVEATDTERVGLAIQLYALMRMEKWAIRLLAVPALSGGRPRKRVIQ